MPNKTSFSLWIFHDFVYSIICFNFAFQFRLRHILSEDEKSIKLIAYTMTKTITNRIKLCNKWLNNYFITKSNLGQQRGDKGGLLNTSAIKLGCWHTELTKALIVICLLTFIIGMNSLISHAIYKCYKCSDYVRNYFIT